MSRAKIQAFTILEVTVTMILAAIVISITYTAFDIISRSFQNYKEKQEEVAIMVKVDELLNKDFNRATLLLKNGPDGIILKSNDQQTEYLFGDSSIIRTTLMADTFKVHMEDLQMYNERKLVTTETFDNEKAVRIDELSFTITYQERKIPYHYYKQYSSENLISR